MKRSLKKLKGLPGGPNEKIFSTDGYRSTSPDVNNPFNIIPSGNITMKEKDGSPLRKGPLMGTDNLGNSQIMFPGADYQFPGNMVIETLLAKRGGQFQNSNITATNKLFAVNKLFKKRKKGKRARGIYNPKAKYTYDDGGERKKRKTRWKNVTDESLPQTTRTPIDSEYLEKYPDFQPYMLNMPEVALRPKKQPTFLRRTEDTVNEWLGNPMDRAAREAAKTRRKNDPVDNFRHPMAGYYTAQKIGPLGANALGILHELTTLTDPRDTRPWYNKLRESAEDIYNNNEGASLSFLPESWAKSIIGFESDNNLLPDGVSNPRGKNMYRKEDGGEIELEIDEEDIDKYVKGGYIVEDISVPSLTRWDNGGEKRKRKNKNKDQEYETVTSDEKAPESTYTPIDPNFLAENPDVYSQIVNKPEVSTGREGSDIGKLRAEYRDKNPMDIFLDEKKRQYLKKNKGLNKAAGVTMENFPEDVLQNFMNEYDYKTNNYAVNKLGKKEGWNPKRRGEWVDELTPGERDAVAESKYGSKLQPSYWSRSLAGIQELGNAAIKLLPGEQGDVLKYNIPGLTKKEQKEIAESKIGALETLAPMDLPGVGIANLVKNVGLSTGSDYKELPNVLSGEKMANVEDKDVMAFNLLNYAGAEAIPELGVNLVKGIGRGVAMAPEAISNLGKFIGTEEGLLSNAYKFNPRAGRLGTYNRVVGEDAIIDLQNSGLVRAGDYGGVEGNFGSFAGMRTTPYPSFAKGPARQAYIDQTINQGKTPFIISTDRSMKASNLGRHGRGSTMFPVDEAGKYMPAFSANDVKVFDVKPHWLKGYQEVPYKLPGSVDNVAGSLTKTDELAPVINNVDLRAKVLESVPKDAPYVMSDQLLPDYKTFKTKGSSITYDEGVDLLENMANKYPVLQESPRIPIYYHGTTSASLPGIIKNEGLLPVGELIKEGKIPLTGELGAGVAGINNANISTAMARGYQGALDYAIGLSGKNKINVEDDLAKWFERGGRESFVESPYSPDISFYDDLKNKRLTEWQNLSDAEKALVQDNYPVMFGINPTKGNAERFVIPRTDISDEVGISGKINFEEIPSIFVPKSKVAELQQQLGTKTKVLPIEDFMVDYKNADKYNQLGYASASSDIKQDIPAFKSEINWKKWNSEIPENKSLMQEYNAIEEASKANGTWMKNADGTPFNGTPEQFVQQQSQNFKNAFGDNYVIGYHGSNRGNIQEFREGKVGTLSDGIYLADSPKNADSYRLKLNPFSKRYKLAARTENPLTFDAKNKFWAELSHNELINRIGQENFSALGIKPKKKYDTAEVTDIAKKLGYDAVNFENIKDAGAQGLLNGDILRAFYTPVNKHNYSIINPKNIKSLIGNNGMFDMTNPNIYKSMLPYIIPAGLGVGAASQMQGQESNASFKDGGIVSELSEKKIKELVKQGFIIEEID